MRDPLLQSRARRLRNEATDAERLLWRHLRRRQVAGYRFRRQVEIAGFIADFASLEAKVIVELDGGQHQENADYDKQRDRLIEAQGFLVLRFWDNQILQETQSVLDEIARVVVGRNPGIAIEKEHRGAERGHRPA